MTTDAKQDAAQAGLNTGEFDPNKELPVSTLALTESDAMNKLAFSALAPDWVKNQLQGQDGLTDAERVQQQEEERIREARIQAEWQANIARYDDMINRLDVARAKVDEANRKLDERALHMSNGRLAYKIGPHQYVYVDEAGNQTIITDPDALKEAEELDRKNQENGIETANGNQKSDLNKQRHDIDVRQEELLRKRQAEIDAGAPGSGTATAESLKRDQQRVDALSTQAAKDEAENQALLLRAEVATASVGDMYKGKVVGRKNRYDDDADSSESIGRTGTVAEKVSATPVPGKGVAVQAFTESASPTPSTPAPVITPTTDPSLRKDVSYSNAPG